MPTNLYVQWPKRPDLLNRNGLMYFRYVLNSELYDSNGRLRYGLDSRDSVTFMATITVITADGKEKTIELGVPIDSRNPMCRDQKGSQPSLHPDQVFFKINRQEIKNVMEDIRDKIKSQEYTAIARVELHGSLVPCRGCSEFLKNNILTILDPKRKGDISIRDIWSITYRDVSQEYAGKGRGERALPITARRIGNTATTGNQNPETGMIRCVHKRPSGIYSCDSSKIIPDDISAGSEYTMMLRFQQFINMSFKKGIISVPEYNRIAARLYSYMLRNQLNKHKEPKVVVCGSDLSKGVIKPISRSRRPNAEPKTVLDDMTGKHAKQKQQKHR